MTADQLRDIRCLFPHTAQGKVYLNHAGTSPLSTRVVAAMTDYLRERSEGRLENYQHDLPMIAGCKTMIQQLINAESPDRIALTPNTSDAINIIAAGVPWKSGDRILLNDIEFPANVWPYLNLKRFGVELDILPADDGRIQTERVLSALHRRTRLVALSAVQFLSGFRADLKAIGMFCRERNIIFAVDGIQAVGATRVDVQKMHIDALAAGGQKWQTAPHGTGFLYLTEQLQSQIQQAYLGWLGLENPWDFSNYSQPLASSARRYEGGSLVIPSLWGYHAALSTLLEFGIEAIEDHLLGITKVMLDALAETKGVTLMTPRDDRERAGIVTINLNDGIDASRIFKMLMERSIHPALRGGKIRFSPHFYMTLEEMERTTEATQECLQKTVR
jgi:selenocysteine lyase/cysteine desulfurase